MYAFSLRQELWRIILGEEEVIDCRRNPGYWSVENEWDASPCNRLLYSQPFCKLLILQAQISNPFFIFDLLEQVGETV